MLVFFPVYKDFIFWRREQTITLLTLSTFTILLRARLVSALRVPAAGTSEAGPS